MHAWRHSPWIIAAVMLCLAAPATTRGAPPAHDGDLSGSAPTVFQVGMASWYGPWHDGRLTASGEIFNMHRLTAAHRTLPLGSRVVVTDVVTRHEVEVTINDRGPYVKGRIIDLSYAAARKLAAVERGVVPVELRIIGHEPRSRSDALRSSPYGPNRRGQSLSLPRR